MLVGRTTVKIMENSLLCCQNLYNLYQDPECPLQYEPEKRRIRFFSAPPAYRKKGQYLVVYDIFYCPSCGKELPDDLAKEWADTIREKFGVYNILDKKQLSKVPPEYFCDKWWKDLESKT